jgi:protein-tyrosine-phosphatase
MNESLKIRIDDFVFQLCDAVILTRSRFVFSCESCGRLIGKINGNSGDFAELKLIFLCDCGVVGAIFCRKIPKSGKLENSLNSRQISGDTNGLGGEDGMAAADSAGKIQGFHQPSNEIFKRNSLEKPHDFRKISGDTNGLGGEDDMTAADSAENLTEINANGLKSFDEKLDFVIFPGKIKRIYYAQKDANCQILEGMKNFKRRARVKKFLFVCTANTCRSPMAEGFFNDMAAKNNLNLRAESAVIFAAVGQSASKHSIESMRARGIDIKNHASRPATSDLLADFDVILGLTAEHKQNLAQNFPEFSTKIYSLSEYVGDSGDVSDPYGGGGDEYARQCERIEFLVARAIEREKIVNKN